MAQLAPSRCAPSHYSSCAAARLSAASRAASVPLPLRRSASTRNRAQRACSADASVMELSSYKFPPKRPEVLHWFESGVQDLVKNLADAPFVHMVYKKNQLHMEKHRYAPSAADKQQVWRGMAEKMDQQAPELLMLVHHLHHGAVDSPASTVRTSQPSETVLTGITSHEAAAATVHHSSATTTAAAAEDECHCAKPGSGTATGAPFSPHLPGGQAMSWRTQKRQRRDDSLVDYWGVVVQSQEKSKAEGCYVLKTVVSANPVGCQCTHYTLTRVNRGDQLPNQLSAAWLA